MRPNSFLLPSLLAAAALTACGGGGSDGSRDSTSTVDDGAASAYSANASVVASDATAAADIAVQTAQAVIGGNASASSAEDGKAGALAAGTMPLATSATANYTCLGGGTATVSISGGSPATWGNGKFDTGEVYQLSYASCKGAAGWAALDGALTLTVDSASGDASNGSVALTMAASNLAVALPSGSATLNGTTNRSVIVSTDASGVVHLSSHYTAPSFTLATHYNARSSTFTLSALDIRRSVSIAGGVPQSSSINGTHTLSATLPRGAFSYTVATDGTATYAADGTPLSGAWTITLPNELIALTIANASASWTLDRGKDGTIDRTITVSWAQLHCDAG